MKAALLGLCCALAVAAPAAAARSGAPAVGVTLQSCTTGPTAADRSAVFQASMPRIDGSVTMALRFKLYERLGSKRNFRRVPIRGFSEWKRSAPNVAGLVFAKHVDRLAAPAAYRVVVDYRWYDGGGDVVRRAHRRSRVCHQPDTRPDLRIGAITAGETFAPGPVPYSVVVRNASPTAILEPFTVSATAAGAALAPQTVQSLGARESTTVVFNAGSCPAGSALIVTADSGHVIAESREANNSRSLPCPSA